MFDVWGLLLSCDNSPGSCFGHILPDLKLPPDSNSNLILVAILIFNYISASCRVGLNRDMSRLGSSAVTLPCHDLQTRDSAELKRLAAASLYKLLGALLLGILR